MRCYNRMIMSFLKCTPEVQGDVSISVHSRFFESNASQLFIEMVRKIVLRAYFILSATLTVNFLLITLGQWTQTQVFFSFAFNLRYPGFSKWEF